MSYYGDNEKRADWAQESVEAHGAKTCPDEPIENAFRSLLCDMRHLADRLGIDFDRVNAMERRLYWLEISQDGPKARCRREMNRAA